MISITFDKDGTIRFIYDDKAAGVINEVGALTIKRASHVEPVTLPYQAAPKWAADMGPCDGPLLGPFDTREDALEAERAWLLANNVPLPR